MATLEEKELQISPIVQDSVQHNARVSDAYAAVKLLSASLPIANHSQSADIVPM